MKAIVDKAAQAGWAETEVEALLRRWLELRLIAKADGRYLALALPFVPPQNGGYDERNAGESSWMKANCSHSARNCRFGKVR